MMKKLIKIYVILFLFVIFTNAHAETQCANSKSYYKDAFPCYLQIISWVDVSMKGDLLAELNENEEKLLDVDKSEFEELMRLRLKYELPEIEHSTNDLFIEFKELYSDSRSQRARKRGKVVCDISYVKENYPVRDQKSVVLFVQCQLLPLGDFPVAVEISSYLISSTDVGKIEEVAKGMIGDAVAELSAEFLEILNAAKSQ